MKIWLAGFLLLAGGPLCLGQWSRIEPGITGNMRSVRFAGDSIGIIVGHDGLVLRSFDRGLQWEALPNELETDFFDFQFIDDTLILAYGSDKVYASADTGKSWQEKGYLPGGSEFAFFLDGETGFAGGNRDGMFRTADGGANWTRIWDHPADNVIYSEQNAMTFLNDSMGFACGRALKTGACNFGNIIRTFDRGLTWSIVWESPTSRSLINPRKIQALGDSGIIAVDEYFDLIRSDDGGESWTIIPFDPPDPETWFGMEARAMNALNTDTIFVTGEITVWLLKSGNPNKRKILRSTDGGLTWILQYLEDVQCVDCTMPVLGDRLYLCDSFGIVTGSNLILRTDNLGGDIHIRDTIHHYAIKKIPDHASGIRIYPNPTSGELTVEADVDRYTRLSLFSQSGMLIREIRLMPVTHLDLSDLPPAYYILRFSGRETRYRSQVKTD